MTAVQPHATEELRAEHEQLLTHAEELRIAALELPTLAPDERRLLLDRIADFLTGPFAAYAESETRALYPYLDRLLDDRYATSGLAYDLQAVRRIATELRGANVRDTPRLQQLLYELHAIIAVHFRKEDAVYLPLLAYERTERLAHVVGAMREIRYEHAHPKRGDL